MAWRDKKKKGKPGTDRPEAGDPDYFVRSSLARQNYRPQTGIELKAVPNAIREVATATTGSGKPVWAEALFVAQPKEGTKVKPYYHSSEPKYQPPNEWEPIPNETRGGLAGLVQDTLAANSGYKALKFTTADKKFYRYKA